MSLGRPDSHGRYPLTFWMDADDCEGLASCLPSSDGFRHELLALADEIREHEKPRDDLPGISIVVSER